MAKNNNKKKSKKEKNTIFTTTKYYVARMIYNDEDYEVIEVFDNEEEAKFYCKKNKDYFVIIKGE